MPIMKRVLKTFSKGKRKQRMEHSGMLTLREVKDRTEAFFREKGVPNARLDADSLIAHVLELRRLDLYLDLERPLSETQLQTLRELVRRRANREPLQYILGNAPFHELQLKVDARALIPRPETEELFELVQAVCAEHPPAMILELGTGSGALAIALARQFPDAELHATDISTDAVALARENAAGYALDNRITFQESDWFAAFKKERRFDLIVVNPPYLTNEEFNTAEPEVAQYEPAGALVAGEDGLQAIRTILRAAPDFLNPSGCLVMETGIAQHDAITELSGKLGLESESRNDLSGRPRFHIARKQ